MRELLGSVVLEQRDSALEFGYDEEWKIFLCSSKSRRPNPETSLSMYTTDE